MILRFVFRTKRKINAQIHVCRETVYRNPILRCIFSHWHICSHKEIETFWMEIQHQSCAGTKIRKCVVQRSFQPRQRRYIGRDTCFCPRMTALKTRSRKEAHFQITVNRQGIFSPPMQGSRQCRSLFQTFSLFGKFSHLLQIIPDPGTLLSDSIRVFTSLFHLIGIS